MITFFLEGGPAMYGTLIFAFAALFFAVRHALEPRANPPGAALAFSAAMLASGALGCSLGLVYTARAARAQEGGAQLALALAGMDESLHNLILALVPALLIALLLGAGALRTRVRD